MMGIGPLEIGIVLVIALLVLGPKRLPEAGKSLGAGMRSFKDSLTSGGDDTDDGGRSASDGRPVQESETARP